MIKINLSRKLGEVRWTQADLARKTGIRPTTINELYHELVERVNLEHLDKICEALDCDLSEIIERVPNTTMVVVMPNGYMAIQKYPCTDYCYGENYRSTKGSLERCKKAFEKYSPKTMKALGI